MRELMAHSVHVWESDPEAYSYHPVGYLQLSPQVMQADVPLSAMFGYVSSLRSMTQGRASYTMQFSRYNEVPENVAKDIVYTC